jgi:two-component system, NtrC family, sensor histidine kinase HydH
VRRKQTRVLVVEDNRRHAELIADELQDSGVAAEVEWAETGAAALERLAAGPLDLIVLDYRLPDTDGIELMKTFRGRGIDTPVIFVTTADSVQLAVEAMKIGAEDFVQKQEGYLAVLPLLVREALERQQLRQDKTHLEAELRQAERLASLGILAAGLAHNINNRLTSLKTFFDLIPQRYDDAYFRNEFLRTCQMDLEKIALLVHELTRYAFTEGAASVMQPITELIMRAIGHLDDEINKKQIRIRTEFAEVPRIPLDPEGMKQLFINLLKNAIQASPVGSEILVSLVVEGRTDPHIVARVRDEGPGLPPEMRERIFDPFFTTKDHGLGIGLYLCHKIASLHRGRIEAGNPPGGGAEFTVYLPTTPEDDVVAPSDAVT